MWILTYTDLNGYSDDRHAENLAASEDPAKLYGFRDVMLDEAAKTEMAIKKWEVEYKSIVEAYLLSQMYAIDPKTSHNSSKGLAKYFGFAPENYVEERKLACIRWILEHALLGAEGYFNMYSIEENVTEPFPKQVGRPKAYPYKSDPSMYTIEEVIII